MTGIRFFMPALVLILLFSPCVAQEAGTVIDSDPPGAAITLDGEYHLSATTPCRLPDNINGRFTIEAMMPGYESWRGDITIMPGQGNHYSFTLAPKTRIKASLRSLFIPGWGQSYSNQKQKAFILTISTLGFAVGTLLAHNDFARKRDDYDQAVIDLGNAVSYDEVLELRARVVDKNRSSSSTNMMVAFFIFWSPVLVRVTRSC